MTTLYTLDEQILSLNGQLDRSHNRLNRWLLARSIDRLKHERDQVFDIVYPIAGA